MHDTWLFDLFHLYDSSRMSHDRKCTIGLIAIDCIGGLVGLWCLMPLSTIFQVYRELVLVEETRVPGGNHWPAANHWQTLSYNVVSSTPRHEQVSNSKL